MADYKFVSLQQGQSPWIPGEIITVGGYFDLANGAPGLALNDTITADELIPEGVKVLKVEVLGSPADTSVSATGTFSAGDGLSDTEAAARYILAGSLAKSNGTRMLVHQNVPPTIVKGEYTKGVGYVYTSSQDNSTTSGKVDFVMTVTAAIATAATTGVVYAYVTYACVGLE